MKLTMQRMVRTALGIAVCIAWISMEAGLMAQGFTTTTVQGTVYLANGQPGAGTLHISWPAFTTANNQAVAAGRTNVTIAADGFISVKLAPNLGATPAGLYYTAVYHLSDGTTSTEYWVVPAAAQANLSQVRAQVMPAAQAVQAVSKGYVDQSMAELTQSLLTASGGSLSGPLYLNGDPKQPAQAATKRYVDNAFANTLPVTGGAATGPLTSVQLGAAYQVDQFPGSDFGARLQACLNRLDPVYGGTCDARNFTGDQAISASIIITTANATVQLPCATLATANQIVITPGTRNVTLHGCASRGASDASGSQGGTVFLYSGTGPMVQVGDHDYAVNTLGFHLDNVVMNTTASADALAQAFAAYRTQEINLQSLYILGNSNQTGMTLDGTGNYTGGTFQDIELGGFGTALNAIGHQLTNPATTDWVNASTFVRLHINCPTNNGNPIAGTYGINLLQGDGNTFTGGDVEGCATALHLGPNAQNNTIVGLRNENSTSQVVADAGSSYNNWITGGTMFTGKLADNGTRNSFLDTFHRSFNALNGDWYGSQADTTVTNHYRLGTGTGNERGLLNRYQTDSGYRWTMGLSDAGSGEQFYQLLDELNNVYRLSIGQYNSGYPSSNNQTVVNAAGTGAVVLNGSANSGTGGVIFGSGGPASAAVATINNAGNAQFNGTLQVGGASTFTNSTTVKNQADAEIDSILWAGTKANQKESFTYKDYLGASQWHMLKDANNNWALNSAVGGINSFKAYQSSNSGDTYINASNNSGHIRFNYEPGSGSETDIYSGPNASLVAAFLGTSAIKFPGLAAASGRNCLQIDNSGYISNTGTPCGTGTGTNGTVNAGNAGQVAYYSGNGTVIAGTTSVAVAAGGTGATTAAQALQNLGAQGAMPGVASDGGTGMVVSGKIAASTTVASVNKVLNVLAAPYNAKCDGVTDDRAAIQAAFNDALPGSSNPLCTVSGCSIQFPAGTCKTSTITWKGQPFFGAGISATAIQGQPGQDVFVTPDGGGWAPPIAGTSVRDLRIKVDNTVDASGAPQGNLAFPNRIAGTAGGLGNPITPAISPGPEAFGTYNGFSTTCTGAISSDAPSTLVLSGCPPLTRIENWRVIGAPITVNGVGTDGANLATTIAAVVNATTLTLASPAVTGFGSNLSGTFLNPITPPWYMGNCGFAFPDSDGANPSPNLNDWTFSNIQIIAVNGPYQGNHSCGIFVQAPPYATHFDKVQIQGLWGGYVEALPAMNPAGTTWTGDTSSYKDIDLQFDTIPFVIMGGNHRTFSGINVYGGMQHQSLGPMWLDPMSSASISRIYFECQTSNTGELSRYSGSYGINIEGGSLDQCPAPHYVLWNASRSVVNAQIYSLQIAAQANQNTFTNTSVGLPSFVDNGLGNSVQTNGNASSVSNPRSYFANRPQAPLGQLDAGWLLSGNSATPYTSGSDLLLTCQDFNFATLYSGTGQTYNNYCVADPNGTEITKSYFQALQSDSTWSAGWNMGPSSQGTGPLGKLLKVGDRLPRAQMNFVVVGRCPAGACTQTYSIKNNTASNSVIKSATLSFGADWTVQTISGVNLSTASTGDQITVATGAVSPWTTGSEFDTALWAFEPINSDTVNAALASVATTYAPLNSAALTGTPTAPTQPCGNDAVITNRAYVTNCGASALPEPAWLLAYGDGSEGAFACTSGTCTILAGEHWYTTCDISAGAIVAVSSAPLSGAPLIMRCSVSANISGTISYSVKTGGSSGIAGNANYGGGGGGGGGGTGAGTAGGGYVGTIGGGAAGSAGGGTAGNPASAPTYLQKLALDSGCPYFGGYQCGGSQGGAGNGSVIGGRGGGEVVVVSPRVDFYGSCDASGGNGNNATANNQGAGGGGAGGFCIFRSPAMTNAGTFVLTGGSPGSCLSFTGCGGGAAGASGWSKVYTQ